MRCTSASQCLRASSLGAHLNGEISAASLAKECGHIVVRLGRFLGCEGEIAEVGSLRRGAFRPEDEKLASILRGVRAMCLAGLEMQRSAGLVLLALVGKVALDHIERLGHAFVEMCRNDRAGVHNDVQHHRPQRVIRVAHLQRDVALTGEGETIRLELTVEYFLIDHDTVSRFRALLSTQSRGCTVVPGTYEKVPTAKLKRDTGAELRIALRSNGLNLANRHDDRAISIFDQGSGCF